MRVPIVAAAAVAVLTAPQEMVEEVGMTPIVPIAAKRVGRVVPAALVIVALAAPMAPEGVRVRMLDHLILPPQPPLVVTAPMAIGVLMAPARLAALAVVVHPQALPLAATSAMITAAEDVVSVVSAVSLRRGHHRQLDRRQDPEGMPMTTNPMIFQDS